MGKVERREAMVYSLSPLWSGAILATCHWVDCLILVAAWRSDNFIPSLQMTKSRVKEAEHHAQDISH